jgi:hypothetical protein
MLIVHTIFTHNMCSSFIIITYWKYISCFELSDLHDHNTNPSQEFTIFLIIHDFDYLLLPQISEMIMKNHLNYNTYSHISHVFKRTLESANKDEMTLIPCPIHPIEYPYFLSINISTLKRTGRMEKQ